MKKYMLNAAAVVLAVGASAFTSIDVPARAVANQYRFNGTQLSQVHDISKWSQISGTLPSCSGTVLPCVITVTSGSLQSYLDARSNEQVRDQADMQKN